MDILQELDLIFGIVGSIFGIIGVLYGIKKKRELAELQQMTEKTKQKAYRAKGKESEMKTIESFSKFLNNCRDLFRSKN